MSKRGDDWLRFSELVHTHIEEYTVPQYGDKGEDQASAYTAQDCVRSAKKYLERFGKNQRPGQEYMDMLKAAHYIQIAAFAIKPPEDMTWPLDIN